MQDTTDLHKSVEFRESVKGLFLEVFEPRFKEIFSRLDTIQYNELAHMGASLARLETDVSWLKKPDSTSVFNEQIEKDLAKNSVNIEWLSNIFWKILLPMFMLGIGWLTAHVSFSNMLPK